MLELDDWALHEAARTIADNHPDRIDTLTGELKQLARWYADHPNARTPGDACDD